jgi:hypothetical protein
LPYTPNPQHRSRAFAGIKSQWTVPVNDEITCFEDATSAHWFAKDCYWGLKVNEGSILPLGTAPPPDSCNAHFAKFVGDSHMNWHGYPVAHWISPWDRPAQSILSVWKDGGYISKVQMARIVRGKKCAL